MQRAGRGITSPSTARWINRDGNLYTFVANNPVDRVDPLGLKIWVCSVETSGFPFYGLGTHAYFWDDRTGTPANKLIREHWAFKRGDCKSVGRKRFPRADTVLSG